MLVECKKGMDRILFQSKGLEVGKVVSAFVLSPNLSWNSIVLEDVGKGMYYIDYVFERVGKYAIQFFADGGYQLTGYYIVRE